MKFLLKEEGNTVFPRVASVLLFAHPGHFAPVVFFSHRTYLVEMSAIPTAAAQVSPFQAWLDSNPMLLSKMRNKRLLALLMV